jgi:hypothetical protein
MRFALGWKPSQMKARLKNDKINTLKSVRFSSKQ